MKFLMFGVLVIMSKKSEGLFFLSLLLFSMFLKCGLLKNFYVVDLLSLFLSILTIWVLITGTILLMEENNLLKTKKKWFTNQSLTLLFLIMCFLSNSILLFYILFEGVFLLTFYLIISWGYSPERFQSAVYMLFYTLVFSFPFLLLIFSHQNTMKDFYQFFCTTTLLNLWTMFLVFVFLIKIPMFMFHLWLPKAHVEAPILGSMILAGVLLKIGGFGISRFMQFKPMMTMVLIPLLLMSCVLVSLSVMFQSDMKSMIAYSSIAHMALVLVSVFSSLSEGNIGMVMLMATHGIISSSMFIISFYFYQSSGSRSILILENLNMYNMMSLWFFFQMMLSLSLPLTSSFMSELFCLLSSISFWGSEIIFFILILFLFGIYGIIMFFYLCMGGNKKVGENTSMLKESLILFISWWPMVILFFLMDFILS